MQRQPKAKAPRDSRDTACDKANQAKRLKTMKVTLPALSFLDDNQKKEARHG